MVVAPEPAVKGSGPLGRRAVDGAVGPAAEHRADEALGLAVGLGPVGPRAQVPDPQDAAGERMDRRDVGRSVVGHDALDPDAVAAEEANGAAEERDSGLGLLVAQDLDVGQARCVVDGDVHVFPADESAVAAGEVALAWTALKRPVAVDAVPGATGGDPAELLDIDVDQLARALALVAVRGLEPQPAELAHPDLLQETGDGRLRHPQHLGDLRACHAQAAERSVTVELHSVSSLGLSGVSTSQPPRRPG